MIATGSDSDAVFELPLTLTGGLAAEEADRRIAVAHRAGDIGARAKAFYLADLADSGGFQELGFHSVELYAEVKYHMMPVTTRGYVATGRALRELPAIDAAFRDGRLFWTQVRELVRVATPETEDAWVRWAIGRSARQITRQVARRRKGERPADPSKRRIGEAWFRPAGRMNAADWAVFTAARQKLEAELDRPVTDSEVLVLSARLLLGTRPDGTVSGRTPVNDTHYRVLAIHDLRVGRMSIEIDGLPEPVDAETARAILGDSNRADLVAHVAHDDEDEDDPHENDGPAIPRRQPDVPTPESMRRQVLARDGYRCRNCGGRTRLAGHHKKYRRFGGRTVPRNLMTGCDGCHTLIHAGLLEVRGTVEGGLRFRDAAGRSLDRLTPAARESVDRMRLRPETRGTVVASDRVTRVTGRGLGGLIGQRSVVRNLRTAVRAASGRGETLDHILLCGPPGLGKTSLARAVAEEMGRDCRTVHAPFVSEPDELARHVAELEADGVLFIDELHRLPARVAESLYAAMETGRITVIGATTDSARLPAALRSRFAIRQHLRHYTPPELAAIIRRAANRQAVAIHVDAALLLARASRDTPRQALALLARARDEAQMHGADGIDAGLARDALRSLEVDDAGLHRVERDLLRALRASRHPLGLRTLADRLDLSRAELLTVHEPFLVRRGLMIRTRRGRAAA